MKRTYMRDRLLSTMARLKVYVTVMMALFTDVSGRCASAEAVMITHTGQWPGYSRHTKPNEVMYLEKMVVGKGYGYLITGSYLGVIDFTVSQTPSLVSGYERTAGTALALEGNYLYEGGDIDLRVFDVSNPAAPLPMGSVPIANRPNDIKVADNYAYVAAGSAGLYVIDISNPSDPEIVGRLEGHGGGRGLVVSGSYAYVAVQWGLEVINISDPARPALVRELIASDWKSGIAIEENRLYLAGEALEVYDLSDPEMPTSLGKTNILGAWAIAVRNAQVYAASGADGLLVYDASEPELITKLSKHDVDGVAYDIALEGEKGYVVTAQSGVQVFDLADPANLRLLGTYEASGYSRSVAVAAGYAYIADNGPPMRAIDVRNPAQPVLTDTYDVGSINRPDKAVVVSGDFAYLLSNAGHIESVDTRDKANLTIVGGSDATFGSVAMAIEGDYLYTVFGDSRCANQFCDPIRTLGGLEVFDISFPGSVIFTLGRYYITASGLSDVYARDIAVAGGYAYVPHTDRFAVVDVSDPKAPQGVGEMPLRGWKVAVGGGYAYVSGNPANAGKLFVVDVRNPVAPVKVEEVATGGFVNGMVVSGQRLYLSSTNLVEVFDLSDPRKPVAVGSAATKGEGEDLAVDGNYIYVADGSWGLQIFRVDPAISIMAELIGESLRVQWPASASNFVMQTTSELREEGWQNVLEEPVVEAGNNRLTFPMGDTEKFFRLRER